MENKEKLTFWKKIKISIFDFEKYQNLAIERIIRTICYIAILVFILALVVAGIYTYRFNLAITNISNYINDNIETITFENNKLNVISKSGEETIQINADINILINTTEEDIEKIVNDSDASLFILNDRFLIKNELTNSQFSYMYEDIAKQYNINTINKEEVVNLLSYNTIKPFLFTVFVMLIIYCFIGIYLPSTLIDILMLSVFGYIVSRILRLRLKYSAIYNIASYSLTLPILLNIIYFVVNSFTGFNINYFEVMYTTVATIYIVAAILIIRSDVIKRQIELAKIIEEQDRVRMELQRREEEEKEQEEKERQKKDDENKHKKKEKEEKGNVGKEPEGNNV